MMKSTWSCIKSRARCLIMRLSVARSLRRDSAASRYCKGLVSVLLELECSFIMARAVPSGCASKSFHDSECSALISVTPLHSHFAVSQNLSFRSDLVIFSKDIPFYDFPFSCVLSVCVVLCLQRLVPSSSGTIFQVQPTTSSISRRFDIHAFITLQEISAQRSRKSL